MSPFRIALRVVPGALALVELLLVVALLHVPIGHAMRARGLPEWRLRDTALVSPLLLVGLFLFFGALNHGMLRYALDVERGARDAAHLAASVGAAGVGLAVAWFGARAVGKLY
jgi:hypothetical protein